MTPMLLVIPTLDEIDHLPRLLQQLRDDSPDATIVVADGGSTDGTREYVLRAAQGDDRLNLMDNPDRIQSAGINRAVATFGKGHEWFVRIDAHCGYPKSYVSALRDAAKANEAVSVVVPMRTVGKQCFQKAAAAAQNSVLGTGGSAHRSADSAGRYVDHGHHALMSVRAFVAAGGYNRAMSHNEDAELDHRLGRLGRIWLEPGCMIEYYPRRTPDALWKQYRNYGKGRAQTLALHRMRPKLRQMVPLLAPLACALACLSPLFGGFLGLALALPLAGWLCLCLSTGALIGLRNKSLCAALSGIAAAIMHLAWGCGFIQQVLFGKVPARAPEPLPLSV